ncbi:MAG: universal stress protein [Cyanobacteria bacterium P01_F01_bin.53]
MLNKILVAIDESASSDWAFDTALAMAQSLAAELFLVHVIDSLSPESPKPPRFLIGGFPMDEDNAAQNEYEHRWKQVEDRYDALLKQKQADAETAGVQATCVKVLGTPGQKICEVAKKNNIDLIVTGNRDRTNRSSISHYLVRHAPCSVTVVHPKAYYEEISPTARRQAVAV